MKKTSVYLTEKHLRRLAHLARLERSSEAEIVRRAIESYTPANAGRRPFALARSGEGPGTSIADVPEDELLAGFGS